MIKNGENLRKHGRPVFDKTANAKKATKRKRAKVTVPKMTNMYHPEGMSLENWQIALRQQISEKEQFGIYQTDEKYCPGEYTVTNYGTKNRYKVVYRGADSKWNYCSCMDFKTSGLGTCKHLEAVKTWIKQNRKKIHREVPAYTSVYIDYKSTRRVRIRIGEDNREAFENLAKGYFDKNGYLSDDAYGKFDSFLTAAKALDSSFRCYDDALDFIIEKREKATRARLADEKYTDEALDRLLTSKLYPYQKEGVRFALKAGKAIIADEMGLGKTIQAIAAAEIYLREGMAESILIVCPTTLKYQWKKEIERFTGSSTVEAEEDYIEDGRIRPKVVVVEGNPNKRRGLYKSRAPFKVVSYQTMTNDIREQGPLKTDLLIMDEIQRLKNWNTLIAKAARKIDSRWSVLLSGTPLENKLEELFANMELVDQFCLGPYYLFRSDHILTDPVKGNTVGYKNLNSIGEQIRDRLIRRTKQGVMLQLPKRSDQFILVPMTEEQASLHAEFRWDLSMILHKYERYHFMTEHDRRRMMLLLSQMRMVADSTFILDPDLKTRSDMKISEVMNILSSTLEGGSGKVVIFSEWERMTRLVAIELDKRGIRFEYLNGSIPAKKRGELVENFRNIPESRVFISTDAGSTGLNLQVANVLINMDLPWNPAVLEQRVARIYRIGQENPVQIINLVSKNSIEEGMIGKLRFKTSMFEGVLDGGTDTVFVSEDKFKKFMESIQEVMKETPVVEYADEEPSEETTKETSEEISEEILEETSHVITEETSGEAESTEIKVTAAERPADGTASHGISSDAVSSGRESDSVSKKSSGKGSGMESERISRESLNDISVTADARDTDHVDHTDKTVNTDSAVNAKPQEIISHGISFLSGLAETLKSPEKTKELVDNLVEVDEKTGKASIKIPVSGKDTVMDMLSLFGRLMQNRK